MKLANIKFVTCFKNNISQQKSCIPCFACRAHPPLPSTLFLKKIENMEGYFLTKYLIEICFRHSSKDSYECNPPARLNNTIQKTLKYFSGEVVNGNHLYKFEPTDQE